MAKPLYQGVEQLYHVETTMEEELGGSTKRCVWRNSGHRMLFHCQASGLPVVRGNSDVAISWFAGGTRCNVRVG